MSTIKAFHKELKRPIRAKWVKAHQDDNKKHEHLSRHAILLNIEADRLATQHRLQHHIRPKHKTEHLQSTKISVCINGNRYHSNIPSNINFHINGTYDMRKYLQDKHNWTDQTWQEIDMEGFGGFHKSLTPSQRIRHSKFVHNLQPTEKRLLQQARIPDFEIATCPCCKTSTEDQIHLYTCTDNSNRESSLNTLVSTLQLNNHPAGTSFASCIHQWIISPHTKPVIQVEKYHRKLHTHLKAAIESQSRIGWMNALLGLLSIHWTFLGNIEVTGINPTKQSLSRNQSRTVIKTLYIFETDIWTSRNTHKHESINKNSLDNLSQETAEIRHHYNDPTLILAEDSFYCDRPLDQLLRVSEATRR